MSVQIFGCWICYNNIQILPYSVRSVEKYVDELVFVDGSFGGKTSNDGTWEYLQFLKNTSSKPVHLIKSKATTLYDKHNEHVKITGNNSSDIWTWQVDSDEVYPHSVAIRVLEYIKSRKYNGICIKLINIERKVDQKYYVSNNIYKINSTQMRIYCMRNGLHFETKDGIFEHIVYDGGKPVQRQDNRIHYDLVQLRVFHYHCFYSRERAVERYVHYGAKDPSAVERRIRSPEASVDEITKHPLSDMTIE